MCWEDLSNGEESGKESIGVSFSIADKERGQLRTYS